LYAANGAIYLTLWLSVYEYIVLGNRAKIKHISITKSIVPQQIALESCSNPQKTQ